MLSVIYCTMFDDMIRPAVCRIMLRGFTERVRKYSCASVPYEVFGDDLDVESFVLLLLAKATRKKSQKGWEFVMWPIDKEILESRTAEEEWDPVILSEHEFFVVGLLCQLGSLKITSHEVLAQLGTTQKEAIAIVQSLKGKGLVTYTHGSLALSTQLCKIAKLPDGRYVAGEDTTGQVTRWLEKKYPDMPVLWIDFT